MVLFGWTKESRLRTHNLSYIYQANISIMKHFRHYLMKSPEYYLIILVMLSGYTPPFSFNPFAISVVAILLLQIVFKNKISGLIIAGLFILVNLFMTGAVISEFKEFQTFNSGAKNLLFGGILILGFNLLMSGLMIVKYVKRTVSSEYNARSIPVNHS